MRAGRFGVRGSGRLLCLGLVLVGGIQGAEEESIGPMASPALPLPDIETVVNPVAREIRFSTTLSRLKYRQQTNTREFERPAGQEKGRITDSILRQEFQVSIWEVPTAAGILRSETLPLKVGAKVGDKVAAADLDDPILGIAYLDRRGYPVDYFGNVLAMEQPTALVFPEGPLKPGDKWSRRVAPSAAFEIPTEATFTFLREGRMRSRLVAEIGMEATAKGELPKGRGLATMSVQATFLFDLRLGRVIHARTRMFQSFIGKASGGIPPEKRKFERAIEMWAMI